MKDPYYCPYCHHRSKRRWNLDVHIKRKHGGHLVSRSLGQYMANNPPLYNQSVDLGHPSFADSIDNTFHPTLLPQDAALRTSQYYTSPTYRPMPSNQSYGTSLSQETIIKLTELKRLVTKYPQFHTIDADEIVKWAIYCSSNGDNKFLDDMLDQLRTIDSLALAS